MILPAGPCPRERALAFAVLFQQPVDDVIQILALNLLSPADNALLLQAQTFGDRPTLAVIDRTPDFKAVEGVVVEAQCYHVSDARSHDAFAGVLPRQPVAEMADGVRLIDPVIAQDARDLVSIEDRDVLSLPTLKAQ